MAIAERYREAEIAIAGVRGWGVQIRLTESGAVELTNAGKAPADAIAALRLVKADVPAVLLAEQSRQDNRQEIERIAAEDGWTISAESEWRYFDDMPLPGDAGMLLDEYTAAIGKGINTNDTLSDANDSKLAAGESKEGGGYQYSQNNKIAPVTLPESLLEAPAKPPAKARRSSAAEIFSAAAIFNRVAAESGVTDRACAACGYLAQTEWATETGRKEWRCEDCGPPELAMPPKKPKLKLVKSDARDIPAKSHVKVTHPPALEICEREPETMSKGGGSSYPMPIITAQNSSSNSTSNQAYRPAAWAEQAGQSAVNYGQNLMNTAGQAYGGQLTAGMTGDQRAAGNLIRGTVGAYLPAFQQAGQMTLNSANPLQAQTYANGLSNISKYMNPYISNVVDSVKAMSDQNLSNALTQTADQAIGSHAFGGSRHGVQEGVATAQNNLNTNNLLSNLLSQGYTQATGLLGQDLTNQQNVDATNQANQRAAAAQYGQLAGAAQSSGTQDISNLLAYGNQDQATNQAGLTNNYNEFQRQRADQYNALGAMNSAVSAAPYSKDTTGSTSSNTSSTGMEWKPSTASANPLATGLGLGLTGIDTAANLGWRPFASATGAATGANAAGAAAAGGGGLANFMGGIGSGLSSGLGSIGSGITGLLSFLSDDDLKANKVYLGEHNGQKIYAYDYKADLAKAKRSGSPMPPKRVGPMASDVKKSGGDVVRIGGKRVVMSAVGNGLSGGHRGVPVKGLL